MNSKYFLSFIILGLGITISGFLLSNVSAQIAPGIQYPVPELGNCQNEAACRTYCDKPQNMKVCLAFAEKNNLMSPEELQGAKNFMAAGAKGPGGCSGKEACEEYCNDISRIDECVAFAEKNNLMPEKDLAEAKKVQAAIKRGVKPPPCGNKKQCDVYCSDSDHMEECISFGVEAGFIQGKELEDVQKMLAAVKRGVKPPPCKGKEACDEYCSNPDNMEVCMNFAIEVGFMSEQEKQGSQKMLQAIKKGVKPPACKGKKECDVYCSEESHFEECMKFAEAAGFMSPEEAKMARKTGGKGPGGCKAKEECEALCNKPENQETCFNFAKEHGMIPEEKIQEMKEGMQKMKEGLSQSPPQVLECLKSNLGTEIIEKIQAGTLTPGPKIGDQMRTCFEQFMPQGPEGRVPGAGIPAGGVPRGMPVGEGFMMSGPGGCKSMEECKAYCSDPAHIKECQKFTGMQPQGMQPMPIQGMQPPSGIMPPEGAQQGMQPPGGIRQFPEGMNIPEQYQQQYQQMMQQGPGGMMPPTGTTPPPSGETAPPLPTSETPPPPPPPEQTGSNLLQAFTNLLKNLFR